MHRPSADTRPLLLHVVYRFSVGGLENGIVNLINHMPASRWRHAVLALTEVDAGFSSRILRQDVACLSLHKPPGHGVWSYPKFLRLLRELKPAVVHTRNLAALEMQAPAWLAGVPVRVHGEHGRDVGDLDGSNRRHQWMRRLYRPFVQQYVALSRDLDSYLQRSVGVPAGRIVQIYNGVDSARFCPATDGRAAVDGSPFNQPGLWIVGTVGRMQTVKDQTLLARAFVVALKERPALRDTLRLVMVGEGPLRAQCAEILSQGGVETLAWLPGERADVPDVMRGLNCFVMPSLAEGISNTILEAMACALPVIATNVGGNADLVVAGQSGEIVPAGDVQAMSRALLRWAVEPAAAVEAGKVGRRTVESRFDLPSMVSSYESIYDGLLRRTELSGP